MSRKPNLYGWSNNGEKETARTLIALAEFYKVQHVGDFGDTVIVQFSYDRERPELCGVWFTLSDNGGEINVEPINQPVQLQKYYPDGPIVRSMPYTSTAGIVTAELMAYRIFCAMTGKVPDWNDFDMPGAHSQEPLKINQKYPQLN